VITALGSPWSVRRVASRFGGPRAEELDPEAVGRFLHLDHRLLSVSPGTVGIEFRWKVGLESAKVRYTSIKEIFWEDVRCPSALATTYAKSK